MGENDESAPKAGSGAWVSSKDMISCLFAAARAGERGCLLSATLGSASTRENKDREEWEFPRTHVSKKESICVYLGRKMRKRVAGQG